MQELTYKFGSGGDIYSVSKDAINFARQQVARDSQPVRVRFLFNDLEVIAYSSSSPYDIVEKYNLQHSLRRARLGYED